MLFLYRGKGKLNINEQSYWKIIMPKGTSFDKWYRHQTQLSDRTTTKEKKNKNECLRE